jgi:CO/xanthine dehydrogenase Mo-binding subunit
LAEVEVDTDTGEVELLRLVTSYDVGRAINPMLAEGQIQGGGAMGVGAALSEELHPYFPSIDHMPDNLGDYSIPTAMDVPEITTVIHECPSTNGPFGAKGMGEMTANSPAPAIINAIHDAVGIWITELPASPERILRALDEQKSA